VKAGSRKDPRIRLDANAYQALRRQILERDHWRCQRCGSISGLEVHHIQHKGRQGEDTEENLISLCAEYHRAMHA
jgi:5-methylcytosine-specific restriction endonuclease McrA